MKKFLSLLLALTMVLSLSTVAFAEDTSPKTITGVTEDNTASFDVTGTVTVNEGAYAEIKYCVEVVWTVSALALDIDNSALYTWDAATLKYVEATPAAANFETKTVEATITLTNKSNAAVNYAIAYADNDSDDMTTSEEAKSGSAVSGKLENADICGAATAAPEDIEHDYALDTSKLTDGSAKTANYAGTVSLTALGNTSAITDGSTLTLGTYTVTLSKYEEPAEPVAETKTVSDILATVEGGFPQYDSASAWKDPQDSSNPLGIRWGSKLSCFLGNIELTQVATKNAEGNYVAAVTTQGMGEQKTTTYTFRMTDNVLTAVTVSMGSTTYTFSAPTT